MSHLKHAHAATWNCLLVALMLLAVVSVLPGQYLTEAFNVPMAPPGAGPGDFPVAADLNQNGYADLIHVVAGSVLFQVDLDPAVSGVGPYIPHAYYYPPGVGAGTLRVIAADVNGDGLQDLAYGLYGTGISSNPMSMILFSIGNGNGTLVPASTVSISMSTLAVIMQWFAMADVNNDGLPDVLAYSSSGGNAPTLSCYLNQFPNWNLAWQVQVWAWGGVSVNGIGGAPRVGDFDGDGNTDLAIQHSDFSVGASWITNVLWGNGGGQFTAPSGSSITGFPVFPGFMAAGLVGAADMNGDGITDLVSSVPATVGGAATELLQVHLGSTTRSLTPAGTFTTPPAGVLFVATFAADFNRDGWGDLLRAPAREPFFTTSVCNFAVTMALGLPGGQFHQTGMNTSHTPCPFPAACPTSVIGDFDGDSDPDLMCVPYYCPGYYFRNQALNGVGCSGSSPTPPGLWPSNAQVGNLNFNAAVFGAPGNALAVLAIATGLSTSPLNACGVYLDLAAPVVYLSGGTDIFGNVVWPLPIPNNPVFQGATFHAQAAVLDPLAPTLGGLNLALTPARTVIVW